MFSAVHDFAKLQQTHTKLASAYGRVLEVPDVALLPNALGASRWSGTVECAVSSAAQANQGPRFLGEYYRVRFIGKQFSEDLTSKVGLFWGAGDGGQAACFLQAWD
jgi:hypothetical protein